MFKVNPNKVFEGVAVGIQDTVGSSLNLVIAVLLHKWAEALTLVSEFFYNLIYN